MFQDAPAGLFCGPETMNSRNQVRLPMLVLVLPWRIEKDPGSVREGMEGWGVGLWCA